MAGSTVYHGLCAGGPKDKQTHAQQDSRKLAAEGGWYVFIAGRGTQSSTWRWIAEEKK